MISNLTSKLTIVALIPLILSIGISTYFPTASAQVMPKLVTDNPKYFEANGMGLAILEYNEWPTTPYDYLKENLPLLTPLAQLSSGILPFDIQCKDSLELVVKPSKESAACVNADSVMKLLERSWMHVFEPPIALATEGAELDEESKSKTEESSSETIQRQSFPSDEQRAMSYVVTFSGGFLTPEQSEPIYTMSKFKHISKIRPDSVVLPKDTPDNPQFILEGLPSLDKKPYYKMIKDWIVDSPTVEAFDARIDIVAGNSTTIQSWVYADCKFVDYYTYLSENLVVFAFHQKFESEIRELAGYECAGFTIEVPE